MAIVHCVRCGESRDGLDRAPLPMAVGTRIAEQICRDCWGEWLMQQTRLINHYGLNVMDPQARQFLMRNMERFLFGTGGEDAVDPSRKGTISY